MTTHSSLASSVCCVWWWWGGGHPWRWDWKGHCTHSVTSRHCFLLESSSVHEARLKCIFDNGSHLFLWIWCDHCNEGGLWKVHCGVFVIFDQRKRFQVYGQKLRHRPRRFFHFGTFPLLLQILGELFGLVISLVSTFGYWCWFGTTKILCMLCFWTGYRSGNKLCMAKKLQRIASPITKSWVQAVYSFAAETQSHHLRCLQGNFWVLVALREIPKMAIEVSEVCCMCLTPKRKFLRFTFFWKVATRAFDLSNWWIWKKKKFKSVCVWSSIQLDSLCVCVSFLLSKENYLHAYLISKSFYSVDTIILSFHTREAPSSHTQTGVAAGWKVP